MSDLKPLSAEELTVLERYANKTWGHEECILKPERLKTLIAMARASLAPKGWPEFDTFLAEISKSYAPDHEDGVEMLKFVYDYLTHHAAPQAEAENWTPPDIMMQAKYDYLLSLYRAECEAAYAVMAKDPILEPDPKSRFEVEQTKRQRVGHHEN